MKKLIIITAIIFSISWVIYADERIVIYGEYPVVEEVNHELSKELFDNNKMIIGYRAGSDYKKKALIEATHFLDANTYGYSFFYKPGSTLMKTEEVFDIDLKGGIAPQSLFIIGDGVYNNVYKVKIGFDITPSVERWMNAFGSNKIRLEESEGTSDFYSGWEGRSSAYRESLRNLVLISAKKRLSSKPISIKGDILLKGQPKFSVGAGRYYCKIKGFVNFCEVIMY